MPRALYAASDGSRAGDGAAPGEKSERMEGLALTVTVMASAERLTRTAAAEMKSERTKAAVMARRPTDREGS